MATSGQINTNTTYESYFWVKWEQSGDQDIPNNRTLIAWSCGVYCGHSFALNAIRMSAVSINGVQVYAGGTYSDFSKGNHTIASGTMWINHSTDGTKTFTISSFTGWLYSNHNYSSNGASYGLTAIPRQATLTAAPNFTDLDNPTISYSNPAGNAVSDLRACISFTGAKDDIAYREISKTGSTYTFNLTDAERDVLRDNTTGTKRQVIFFVRSIIGGVTYYSIIERTLSIVESDYTRPSVNLAAPLNNSALPSAFNGLYVQGKSKVDVQMSATGKYNAEIKSYSAQIDGKTYNSQKFTSDVIQNSGRVKIIGYAKDSRGFTGSTEHTVNVLAYSKPLVIPIGSENAILCYRSDGNGNRTGNSTSLWIKAKKSHHDVSGKNKCALQWRWKKASEEWSNQDWSPLLPEDSASNEYNASVPGVFALTESYTVQIRAIDTVGESDIKPLEVPTQDVALHLGKGGKNVAIGTYCDYSEERTFYSDWKAIFDKDVVIRGDVLIGENQTTLKNYILSVINGGG